MQPFVYSLLASIIVSFVSLLGIFLFVGKFKIQRFTLYIVSFAIGSLLGDAFIHLLPESFENIESPLSSILTVSGLILFFLLEKILRWHHCHDPDCHESDQSSHTVSLNLIGDTVHNFIDGMLIAASFIVDPKLGFATVAAVVLHEIPQEIGDIGIFLHHGLSLIKTIKLNLISAFASILGVLITFALGNSITNFANYLLPITAGGFIYLAATDLIPELHRHNTTRSSLTQVFFIILGIVLMLSLLGLE